MLSLEKLNKMTPQEQQLYLHKRITKDLMVRNKWATEEEAKVYVNTPNAKLFLYP